MGKAKKVLAMFLAAVMMLTAFFAADADHVRAGQKEYSGNDGLVSPESSGDFTENNIEYYVTANPSGSRSGEVYVVGCTFSMEKITIPGTVTRRGSKYNVVGIDNLTATPSSTTAR